MNDAATRSCASPSFARSSGSQMRSNVVLPDHFRSHVPTGTRASAPASSLRDARKIVAASRTLSIGPSGGNSANSSAFESDISRPPTKKPVRVVDHSSSSATPSSASSARVTVSEYSVT